jgi:hypothetical protein
MFYLLQGIVLVLLLIAGLAASFPFLFILDFFFRSKQEEGSASLLPFVATIITLPIIGLSVLIPSLLSKWIIKAAIAIFILDLLFIVPMYLYTGWQKLKGKW